MPGISPTLPTSAPVLEYVCLFTHDLKRKQKRWQDGRLKFHTFNRRAMVYDESGHFIGDTHWTAEYDLEDGEELELDRGGVIVQVAECVGRRDHDITEVFARKQKQKQKQQEPPSRTPRTPATSDLRAAAAATAAVTRTRPEPAVDFGGNVKPKPHFQLRHTPLQHLLSTPKGPAGRAVIPTKSPFEERQQQQVVQSREDGDPPAKRRRNDTNNSKTSYAKSLFGEPLTLSSQPSSSPLFLYQESVQVPHQQGVFVAKDKGVPAANHAVHAVKNSPLVQETSSSRYHARPDMENDHSRVSSPPPRPVSSHDRGVPARRQRSDGNRGADIMLPQLVGSDGSEGVDSAPRERSDGRPEPAAHSATPGKAGKGGEKKTTSSDRAKSTRKPLLDISQKIEKKRRKNEASTDQSTKHPCARRDTNERATEAKEVNNEPDEPTTELRIGPQKKRGLLLVTEKKRAQPNPRAAAKALLQQHSRARTNEQEPELVAQKIVNPATRGKKAARRSDAAGEVPQPLRGLDAITMPDTVTQPRTPAKPTGKKQAGEVMSNPGDMKTTLPGFSKAGGEPWFQPWSKHAHDLLGENRLPRVSK